MGGGIIVCFLCVIRTTGRIFFGGRDIVKVGFEKARAMWQNMYNVAVARNNARAEAGMIKPTLTDPDFVIEEPSSAKDGDEERPTSYLFVKSFVGNDGKKRYFFKSVTVKKDGLEINISNHFDTVKRLREALKKGKLLYRFDGGAQTEQSPAPVSVTTSPEKPQGVEFDSKDTKKNNTDQIKNASSSVSVVSEEEKQPKTAEVEETESENSDVREHRAEGGG